MLASGHQLCKKEKFRRKESSLNSTGAQDIKLHQSENAWISSRKLNEKSKGNSEDLEKEALKRKVQSVLNKLTFQKFKTLLIYMKKLNICTVNDIDLVVELIYENAVYEPHFSAVYAHLCKHLTMIQVSNADTSEKQVNFIALLLSKCELEFESHCNLQDNKINSVLDENELKAEIDICTYKGKKKARRLGNIRFIGELFKLNLVQKPVLMEKIEILIMKEDEESLECMCLLLKTTGKDLENCSNSLEKKKIDEYFVQIQKIVDGHLTSTRIRFLLKDILDLRNNKWNPRRKENVPRTIDEIHKEVALESQKRWQWYQNMLSFVTQSEIEDPTKAHNGNNSCLCESEKPVILKSTGKDVCTPNQASSSADTLDEARRILVAENRRCHKNSSRKKN